MATAQHFVWNPDRPNRIEGVRIWAGKNFLFVPYRDVTKVCNMMIDALEEHQQKETP